MRIRCLHVEPDRGSVVRYRFTLVDRAVAFVGFATMTLDLPLALDDDARAAAVQYLEEAFR